MSELVTQIAGGSAVAAALLLVGFWILRQVILTKLKEESNRSLEELKADLQKESQALEHKHAAAMKLLQTNHDNLKHEHNITFSEFHKRRIIAFKEIYAMLYELWDSVTAHVIDDPTKSDYTNMALGKHEEICDYKGKNALFFEEDHLRSITHLVAEAYVIITHEASKDFKIESWDDYRERLEALRIDFKAEIDGKNLKKAL